MIEYKEVDENGFVVETYVLGEDEIPPFNYIKGWGGDISFFKPRWDGLNEKWVEDIAEIPTTIPSMSIEEALMLAIAELDAQREADKTENEMAIAELAEAMMGGM